MSLKQLLRNAVFGLGLALTPSCSSEPDWGREGEAEAEGETLEVLVEQETTDANGAAFDGAQQVTVFNREHHPLPDVDVTLYQIQGSGDVYLARTPEDEGGLAAFVGSAQPAVNARCYGSRQGRELIIRPTSGTTMFDRSTREVIYNLLQWTLGERYSCDGIYTTEELIEGRERTMRFIAYFDPSGAVQTAYDTVEYAIDIGLLDDLPADREWYVLTPENPLAPPTVIQTDLAPGIFSSGTYAQLLNACGVEFRCTGEEEFCDDFSGSELDLERWETNLSRPHGFLRFNDGILEIPTGEGGTVILDSHSTYSLGDSTLTFEARWKVREREGTAFEIRLVNGDRDGRHGSTGFWVGFEKSEKSNNLMCDNYSPDNVDEQVCNADITRWLTTMLELDRERVRYFIDGERIASSSQAPVHDRPFFISSVCKSTDGQERVCFLDYVKLLRK